MISVLHASTSNLQRIYPSQDSLIPWTCNSRKTEKILAILDYKLVSALVYTKISQQNWNVFHLQGICVDP